LIRCHDEIVFGSVGSEAEPNHGDDRGIVGGQVSEIAIIKEHIGVIKERRQEEQSMVPGTFSARWNPIYTV